MNHSFETLHNSEALHYTFTKGEHFSLLSTGGIQERIRA